MEIVNKYSKSKIYKIVDINFSKMYIGSTTQELSQRMTDHRKKYKGWKQGYDKFVSSFTLFDEFGIDDCIILLLEAFPCRNKTELRKREGEHISTNDCVNRYVSGRTRQQYCIDNKERREKYAEEHKAIRHEREKQYRIKNREAIRSRQNEQFTCECGGKYTAASRARHFRLSKHVAWVDTKPEDQMLTPLTFERTKC